MTIVSEESDRFWFKGKRWDIIGDLPIDPNAVVIVDDDSQVNKAWYRRYIASWQVKHSKLYLRSAEGVIRPIHGKPVEASWISETVFLDADSIFPRDFRPGSLPIGRGFGAVIELDFDKGVLRRYRRIAMSCLSCCEGIRVGGPYWEQLPEFVDLYRQSRFFDEITSSYFEGDTEPKQRDPHDFIHVEDPLGGEPQMASYDGKRLRLRMIAARKTLKLDVTELLRKAGINVNKGQRLEAWEEYGTRLSKSMERRLCEVLEISAAELEEIRGQEVLDFKLIHDAWLDQPIEPVVRMQCGGGVICYPFPSVLSQRKWASLAAMEVWAETLSRIAWRPSALVLSRRQSIHFDALGNKVAE